MVGGTAFPSAAFSPFSTRAAILAQPEFEVNAKSRERLGPGTQGYGTGLARREIDSWGRAKFDSAGQLHLDTRV